MPRYSRRYYSRYGRKRSYYRGYYRGKYRRYYKTKYTSFINGSSRSRCKVKIPITFDFALNVPGNGTDSNVAVFHPWGKGQGATVLPFGVQRNSLYQAYCSLYEEVKCEGLKFNFSCTSTIPDATHPACTFYSATDRTFSVAEMSRAFPTVAQIMTYGSLQAASAINNSVPKFTRRIYSSDLAEKTTFIDTDYSDHNLTIDGGAALPVTCNDAWVSGGANAAAFAPALFLGVHTNSAVQAAGVSYSFHAEGNFYFTFRTPKYGGAVISAKNIDGEPAQKRVRFDPEAPNTLIRERSPTPLYEIIAKEDTLLDTNT